MPGLSAAMVMPVMAALVLLVLVVMVITSSRVLSIPGDAGQDKLNDVANPRLAGRDSNDQVAEAVMTERLELDVVRSQGHQQQQSRRAFVGVGERVRFRKSVAVPRGQFDWISNLA